MTGHRSHHVPSDDVCTILEAKGETQMPTTDTDAAIDAFKEAKRKVTEAQSSCDLSRRRYDGDRTRLQDASEKLAVAHRALLTAIGEPEDGDN